MKQIALFLRLDPDWYPTHTGYTAAGIYYFFRPWRLDSQHKLLLMVLLVIFHGNYLTLTKHSSHCLVIVPLYMGIVDMPLQGWKYSLICWDESWQFFSSREKSKYFLLGRFLPFIGFFLLPLLTAALFWVGSLKDSLSRSPSPSPSPSLSVFCLCVLYLYVHWEYITKFMHNLQ